MQGVVGFDGMSITRTTLGGLESGIQDAREYDWLYVNMHNMPRGKYAYTRNLPISGY